MTKSSTVKVELQTQIFSSRQSFLALFHSPRIGGFLPQEKQDYYGQHCKRLVNIFKIPQVS